MSLFNITREPVPIDVTPHSPRISIAPAPILIPPASWPLVSGSVRATDCSTITWGTGPDGTITAEGQPAPAQRAGRAIGGDSRAARAAGRAA